MKCGILLLFNSGSNFIYCFLYYINFCILLFFTESSSFNKNKRLTETILTVTLILKISEIGCVGVDIWLWLSTQAPGLPNQGQIKNLKTWNQGRTAGYASDYSFYQCVRTFNELSKLVVSHLFRVYSPYKNHPGHLFFPQRHACVFQLMCQLESPQGGKATI